MERAVFVSIVTPDVTLEQVMEYLDELQFLAETAGVMGDKRFVQKMERANSKSYVGTGKLEEIKTYIIENEIDLVIFDDELSPSQLRNLDKELNCSKNGLRQNAGRIGPIPVSAAASYENVDPFGEAARRYRHERSG